MSKNVVSVITSMILRANWFCCLQVLDTSAWFCSARDKRKKQFSRFLPERHLDLSHRSLQLVRWVQGIQVDLEIQVLLGLHLVPTSLVVHVVQVIPEVPVDLVLQADLFRHHPQVVR